MLLNGELGKLDKDFKVLEAAEKTNLPEHFKDTIAVIRFEDIGPTKALGFFCNTADSGELCFVVKAGKCAYAAEMISAWRYFDDNDKPYIPMRKTENPQYVSGR